MKCFVCSTLRLQYSCRRWIGSFLPVISWRYLKLFRMFHKNVHKRKWIFFFKQNQNQWHLANWQYCNCPFYMSNCFQLSYKNLWAIDKDLNYVRKLVSYLNVGELKFSLMIILFVWKHHVLSKLFYFHFHGNRSLTCKNAFS